MNLKPLSVFDTTSNAKGQAANVFYIDAKTPYKSLEKLFGQRLHSWQMAELKSHKKTQYTFQTEEGQFFILRETENKTSRPTDINEVSAYGFARDEFGAFFTLWREQSLVEIDFIGTSKEKIVGALVGLDLAIYNFVNWTKGKLIAPGLKFFKGGKALEKKILSEARAISTAVNMSRHLVNLPPCDLNPTAYAAGIKKLLSSMKNTTVEIWSGKKLESGNFNLLKAVGDSAKYPPCVVKIRYRPRGAAKKKPVAFVGKGITFDSGGLDIKPVAGMRLMKKDMGGSSVVAALAYYMTSSGHKQPADFYLALAENAVDNEAMRPGDIFTAKSGKTVEIHNTDAEGRLVLADTITAALEASEKPSCLIDVATLTGAGKIALGADVTSLFSNNNALATKMVNSGMKMGDPCWRMPLYQRYAEGLASPFADMVNAASGYGGSITAALFLEKFVGKIPWAHFDIYAWKDSPRGALQSSGGSGQTVQNLIGYLN